MGAEDLENYLWNNSKVKETFKRGWYVLDSIPCKATQNVSGYYGGEMNIDYRACASAVNGFCELTGGYCNGNYNSCYLNYNSCYLNMNVEECAKNALPTIKGVNNRKY